MEKKDSASEEAVQGIQENGVEPQAVEPKPEPPCEPYRKPVKMVAVPSQMDGWQKSLAFADVVMFILGVNKAVRCKPRSSPRPQSEVCMQQTQTNAVFPLMEIPHSIFPAGGQSRGSISGRNQRLYQGLSSAQPASFSNYLSLRFLTCCKHFPLPTCFPVC